jgi:hypothetical protein
MAKRMGKLHEGSHHKQYFPHILDRLKLKININPVFAAMVS